VFLAASALYNQRRSRRILAVLSKGIERYEYLAGNRGRLQRGELRLFVALGVTGAWTFTLVGSPSIKVLPLAIMLLLASVLAGTVALFSLLHESAVHANGDEPGAGILGRCSESTFLRCCRPHVAGERDGITFRNGVQYPDSSAVGVLETVLLWVAASVIFARKDIAVSVE